MQENVKRYTTNSGIGTVFQVGLNYETVQPGHDFVRLADHQAALDAVLKEAVWAMDIIKAIFVVDGDECQLRASDFLASPAVRDYRTRQEQG